ncbi:hypothetical protein GWK47_027391 [Chionoecetes opilio]|uniref:Uncharacterized protein n=1 Tax=Chionoecetes opilio TaxID=41210 RepID=A0A8J8WA34_CHIOP|nr:hypothetical protein GWK47_027391 [Chionoecetes opilio]
MPNEPTEVQATRDPFQETFNLGTTSSRSEKVTRSTPTRPRLNKFLGRRMEKNHSTGRSSRARSCMSHCEQLCFKITKESGRGLLKLKSSQKKQQHASFSMHFMQQNWVQSVIITAKDTDVMVLVWACATRSHPTCSRSAGRRIRTRFSGYPPPLSGHCEASAVIH